MPFGVDGCAVVYREWYPLRAQVCIARAAPDRVENSPLHPEDRVLVVASEHDRILDIR